MNHKPYLFLSAVIFALVGVMHLLRAANGWMFQIHTWAMPVAISWVAGLVAIMLSIWAFRMAAR